MLNNKLLILIRYYQRWFRRLRSGCAVATRSSAAAAGLMAAWSAPQFEARATLTTAHLLYFGKSRMSVIAWFDR